MKKLFGVLVATFWFIGCNSFENTATIGIPITFEESARVIVNEVMDYQFTDLDTIPVYENAQIIENQENISSFQIKSVTYSITRLNADTEPLLKNASIIFSKLDDSSPIVTTLENIDLKETLDTRQEHDIEIGEEERIKLEELFKDNDNVKVVYNASMDTTATYTLSLFVNLSIKVGI